MATRFGILLLMLSPLLLTACVGGPGGGPMGAELHETCAAERPQVCTMEYAPVCAFLDKGERREYASACSACSDAAVAAYIRGSCP
jgi:hypothetical protein